MVEKLELFFAAYDPAIRSVDGRYWVWSSPMIASGLLDDAHASVTRHDLCGTPNSLHAEDLWGGFVGLSQQWCVLYRYYNGGRDLAGRPERAVMLFAFMNRRASIHRSCSYLLDEAPFSEWALLQPMPACPPAPGIDGRMTFTLHTEKPLFSTLPLPKPVGRSLIEYNTIDEAWTAVRTIAIDDRFLLKFRRHQQVWKKPELVRLDNCSDQVGLRFSSASIPSGNRTSHQIPETGAFPSAEARLRQPSWVWNKNFILLVLFAFGLGSMGLNFLNSTYESTNPPQSETQSISNGSNNSGDNGQHLPPSMGKTKDSHFSTPKQESVDPASEPDPGNENSPDNPSQK